MFPARLNAAERYLGVSGTTVPTKASAIRSGFAGDADLNARDVARSLTPDPGMEPSKAIGSDACERIRGPDRLTYALPQH